MTTQTRPSVDFRCLTISANNGAPDQYRSAIPGRYCYRYAVTVRSDATGSAIRFNYWDSIANYNEGRRGLAGDELLYAFRAFASDADAGRMDFPAFVDEFGYTDRAAMAAYDAWKGCKAAWKKWQRLFINPNNIGDVLAELSEAGIE